MGSGCLRFSQHNLLCERRNESPLIVAARFGLAVGLVLGEGVRRDWCVGHRGLVLGSVQGGSQRLVLRLWAVEWLRQHRKTHFAPVSGLCGAGSWVGRVRGVSGRSPD